MRKFDEILTVFRNNRRYIPLMDFQQTVDYHDNGFVRKIMFTQCPECKKSHLLSIQQLKKTRGKLRCSNCHTLFDSLVSISEQAYDNTEFYIPQAQQSVSWNKTPKLKKSLPWGIGFTLGLVLFAIQLICFESYALTQSVLVRPWLEKTCMKLDCQLPVYNNVNEFDVLHSSFQESDDQTYNFLAAINNQGLFAQAYPKIKLTLVDFSGKPFAKRIFYPEEFSARTSLVNSNETFEINLKIAMPEMLIGGYSLSLL